LPFFFKYNIPRKIAWDVLSSVLRRVTVKDGDLEATWIVAKERSKGMEAKLAERGDHVMTK
jgi:hypothetical protein